MSNSLVLLLARTRVERAAHSQHLADWHSANGFIDALVVAELITEEQYRELHNALICGKEPGK